VNRQIQHSLGDPEVLVETDAQWNFGNLFHHNGGGGGLKNLFNKVKGSLHLDDIKKKLQEKLQGTLNKVKDKLHGMEEKSSGKLNNLISKITKG